MKIYLMMFFTFLGIHTAFSKSKCIVYGRMDSGSADIKYYKPILGFGNSSLMSTYKSEIDGRFSIDIEVEKPTTSRFLFGRKNVWLLLEPNDSIFLDLSQTKDIDHTVGWLKVKHKNAAGYEFYNQVYNINPAAKFAGVNNLFENIIDKSSAQVIDLIGKELGAQTAWLDSLRNKKLISNEFYDHFKYEISALIASEVCVLSRRLYRSSIPSEMNKRISIMDATIKYVDPNDSKFWTATSAYSYYDEYLKYKLALKPGSIDTAKALIDEIPYMELSSKEIKWYVLGKNLVNYYNFSPELYDYCKLTKKYISLYGQTVFSDYLISKHVCDSQDKSNKTFVGSQQGNFFDVLNSMPRRRYYIDLWATWCGPCKKEFENYTEEFYKFLSDNNIQPLFISIDEPVDELKWKKVIETVNLRGNHLLANKKLQKSMKEIIFNNDPVSIPRYLLISEKGKILLDNAKRPSDGTLKAQLLDAIKKNSR